MLKDKKILLVRLSAMGDVVFNIPLANLLKNNGAELHWLVSEKGYDIVNNNPCNDKVILAPIEKWKKNKNKIQNFKEYLNLIKLIRNEKYDIVIDTQLILKSLIWTLFSGGKRRIVAKSAREGAIIGGNEIIEPLFNNFKLHAVYNYFKFAKYLRLDTTKIIKTLPKINQETKDYVDGLLSVLDKNKPILTIAPATTWKNKHWSRDNWFELISKIDANKYNIVFVGTKNDSDLISLISQNKYLNLAGKTNLKQLIELFNKTDILISLDSGSTHLAWLTDKPKIISIFTSTPKSRYAPIGDKHIALQGNLDCQPCHRKKCPLACDDCTKYPMVDEVYNALEEISKDLY